METTVLKLAAELCGAAKEDVLLDALCNAAEAAWKRRLNTETVGEGCEDALRCAAAFTAAADYLGKSGAGPESFTVGDVTIKGQTGQSALALAEALRQSAERLMEPYAASGNFCFRGVQG